MAKKCKITLTNKEVDSLINSINAEISEYAGVYLSDEDIKELKRLQNKLEKCKKVK